MAPNMNNIPSPSLMIRAMVIYKYTCITSDETIHNQHLMLNASVKKSINVHGASYPMMTR